VVATPLSLNRAELMAGTQRETQLLKRHALSAYLFDPSRSPLSFPTPLGTVSKDK
jgi:hypothetical protein